MQRQMAIFAKTEDVIMSKTISLQQSVMKDVVSLMNDTDAMMKLKSFIKDLKKEKHKELSKAEKQEVLNDLREAFKELKDVKEGKKESRPVEELLYEL